MTIGLCTDSSAQLPAELIERYGIEVVPITVVIDDHEYLEGVDLDVDEFYAELGPNGTEHVTTIQPSPGQFALAYDELIGRGCTEILSIHLAATASGTLNAARLAAHSAPVPVRLVDSGTVSFGVGCCVWAAAEAIIAGATLDQAASIAESLAPSIGNAFVATTLDLLRAPGPIEATVSGLDGIRRATMDAAEVIAVMSVRDGQIAVVDRVQTLDEAIRTMADLAIGWGERVRVAVGYSSGETAPFADALQRSIEGSAHVVEIVRYRVGPSIAAHTGVGSAGLFVFPVG